MNSRSTSPLRHVAFVRPLVMFVVVSVLAGFIVAAIALPVVAGLGLVAKTASTDWESLPDDLTQSQLPVPSKILAADGSLLGEFYAQDRVPVTITQIPTITKQALLAIEDSRFYDHHGVDFQGSLRALVSNIHGDSLQGGSTLTQQYVKNMLLNNATDAAQSKAANETTIERKIKEARYALELEKVLTKDQILEGYFNIAYFGEGAYGIGAASEHYFGIPVQQLNLDQSALLVGLVQNPSAHDPVRHPTNARNRRDTVLARMATVNFITPAMASTAEAIPMRLHVTTQTDGCQAGKAPYFCEWIVSSLQSDPTFGATKEARTAQLLRGGLTIKTTLNWTDERAAEAALATNLPADHKDNPRGIAGAEVLIDPKTGAVLAMTANQPWGYDAKAGQNVNPYATGASSGFQGGSTFKLFTMITALEQGIPTSQVFNSPSRYYSTIFPGYSKKKGGVSNAGDSEAGVFNMTQATAFSVNTYYIQLEEKVGVPAVVATARSMGVDPTAFDPAPITPDEGSFTLGTREVSPLEMAGAYATIANHGTHCIPYGVAGVTIASGAPLPVQSARCTSVMSPDIADTATELLTHVITDKGATANVNGQIGRPAAGKTGTTNSYGAAWFDGFTPDLAGSVWMGDPAGPNHLGGLVNLTINDKPWVHMFGGDIPTMIWRDTFKVALAGVPVSQFSGAAAPVVQSSANVTSVLIPAVVNRTAAEAATVLGQVGLLSKVAPVQIASPTVPAGTVLSSVPAAGAKVASGSTVVLTVSSGPATLSPSPTVATTPPTGPPVAPTTSISAAPTLPVVPPTTPAAVVTTPAVVAPPATGPVTPP